MTFLRNIWYVAMWSKDLEADKLVGRKILNTPVVIYRKADGQPAAIGDICPHRFAPLHMGKRVDGNRIQCAYHGLEFDSTGACTKNPHGAGRVPTAARVKNHPIVEKHSLLWIWMGDKAPDPALIPNFSMLDENSEHQVSRRDWLMMDANYELITDNLLDLSHTAFLHDGILGSAETIKADLAVDQKGDTLFVARAVPNVPIPGFFDLMFKRNGCHVDLWADMRWDLPACLMNDTGVTLPGAPRREGTGIYGMHFLTPETETTSYYHFAAVRWNPISWGEPVDTEIREKIADLRRYAFEFQDQGIIRAQQEMMVQFPNETRKPIFLETDVGPARYKRILERKLNEEQTARQA
jgi:phenylpropionate dioxygenase-like ring-hydroxylating dioxygenase large terminal subunit